MTGPRGSRLPWTGCALGRLSDFRDSSLHCRFGGPVCLLVTQFFITFGKVRYVARCVSEGVGTAMALGRDSPICVLTWL